MDFEMTYTDTQEAFRSEVSTWLDENVPDQLTAERSDERDSLDEYKLKRELGLSLGEGGWLYPAAPPEFGGGGLDVQSVLVLDEEMHRRHLGLPPYYDSGGWIGSATILVWGT